MLVHTVYFWLKPDLSEADRASFVAGVESLRSICDVRSMWHGTPAATNRPVIDRSYSHGLTLVFDDLKGHDAYQIDPIHQRFVDAHKQKWTKVTIYDVQT